MRSLWFETALLPGGWQDRVRMRIAAGRIAALEPGVRPESGDERHAIGVPGLGNAHSHAFQRAIAGLTETRGPGADSFWTWRELMYRFLERLGPDELEAVTAMAFAEMLEGGFTRVAEFHYVHHASHGEPYADPAELATRVVSAAARTGIGLTLLPVFYAHSGFGGAAPAPRQRRFINSTEQFARLLEATRRSAAELEGAIVGVAPHSLRAVTPEELAEVVRLSPRGPIHMHIAEQRREVDECRGWSGRRPIEWLMQEQPVDQRWCLVHATHATNAELRSMAASGAVVGLCPLTESSLGDGIFPAPPFTAAGGRFAIGSDSNVQVDAAAELRMLEYSQRLALCARNVLASGPGSSTGRSLFDAALAGGTQALGVPATQAGLVVGAPADLVSLAPEHAALLERRGDALIDSWIFCAGRASIDCVWTGGVRQVSAGQHREHAAIAVRYHQALKVLLG